VTARRGIERGRAAAGERSEQAVQCSGLRFERPQPRTIREVGARWANTGSRKEVAASGEDVHGAGAVEGNRDDLVHHLGGRAVALRPVIFTHCDEALAAWVDAAVRKTKPSCWPGIRTILGSERHRRLVYALGQEQTLRHEVGVDDAAVGMERVRAAAIFMHSSPRIRLLWDHVDGASLVRGWRIFFVPAHHLPALFLRAAFEPVQAVVLDSQRAQPNAGAGDELCSDGARPRAIREVLSLSG
jgi:hypothetical protein